MPLIYRNIGYAVLFALALLLPAIAEFLGPARWRGSGERKRRDQGSLVFINTLAGVGFCLYFLCPFFFQNATVSPGAAPLLFSIGLALAVIGMLLRWWAIRALGSAFVGVVLVQADQKLVETGPYAIIRHPAYTGAVIAALGTGLMMTNWVSCAVLTLCLLVGFLYRIKVEEAFLRLHLHGYEEYVKHTTRLIPFVY